MKRSSLCVGFALLLISCSSSNSNVESSVSETMAIGSTTEISSPPESTSSNSTDKYRQLCEAAYSAGLGNSASQEKESWVTDCAVECKFPENKTSCSDMAKQFNIDLTD